MARTLGIRYFRKTVAVAGTAEPLSSSTILTSFFRIRALSNNNGNVYWSNEDVDNTADFLAGGDFVDIGSAPITSSVHPQYDLSKIYIDVDNNGEGVIVTYAKFDD